MLEQASASTGQELSIKLTAQAKVVCLVLILDTSLFLLLGNTGADI